VKIQSFWYSHRNSPTSQFGADFPVQFFLDISRHFAARGFEIAAPATSFAALPAFPLTHAHSVAHGSLPASASK
jgi:hypothetical protein